MEDEFYANIEKNDRLWDQAFDRVPQPEILIPTEVEPGVFEFRPVLLRPDAKEVKAGIGKLKGLMTSDKADWETPDWFFAALHAEFNFTVDVAATMENRKVDKFFSIHQDAFRLQWKGIAWLNPPYGREIGRWLAKAKQSALDGATVVVLVPARTDTNWWYDHARMGEVRFLKGRLRFKGASTSAPFPSALVIFRPGLPRSTTYWDYNETKTAPFYGVRQLD